MTFPPVIQKLIDIRLNMSTTGDVSDGEAAKNRYESVNLTWFKHCKETLCGQICCFYVRYM